MTAPKVAVVIPARGGSKGIPRKNLRPLAGRPLMSYAIQAARLAFPDGVVAVSTEDDEIALMAERFGARVVRRPAQLAGDEVTLDPVIVDAVAQLERDLGQRFDAVATVQPTSPLIRPGDIRDGVQRLRAGDADTVLSVTDDRHLRWTLDAAGKPRPDYAARVNRQKLPRTFRETGSLVVCRREQLERGTRIGARIDLVEVPADLAVDIDSFSDLALCEYLLTRKRVVFVVGGNRQIGLGHAFRGLVIAHELVRQHIEFLCPRGHEMAAEVIASRFYPVSVVDESALIDELRRRQPDLVVNDILDTRAEFIAAQKALGARVVNFEDLGSGIEHADLVINALYPDPHPNTRVLSGHEYFCLRDEFLFMPEGADARRRERRRLLATFGGVDEGDLTGRIIALWPRVPGAQDWALDVVLGPGYAHGETLASTRLPPGVSVTPATTRISDHMLAASAAVTSGGRTVLELVAMKVPTVVVCQNLRETTHTFAGEANGVLNLGYRGDVADAAIVDALARVIGDAALRERMLARMQAADLRQGKARVVAAINRLLD